MADKQAKELKTRLNESERAREQGTRAGAELARARERGDKLEAQLAEAHKLMERAAAQARARPRPRGAGGRDEPCPVSTDRKSGG